MTPIDPFNPDLRRATPCSPVMYSLTGILEGRHTIPVINKRVLSISKLYFFEPGHVFAKGLWVQVQEKFIPRGLTKMGFLR